MGGEWSSSGPGGQSFFAVGPQTRVDTESILDANGVLRGALEGVAAAAEALSFAAVAAGSATPPAPELVAGAQEASLAADALSGDLEMLIFWREQAAQIFAAAEGDAALFAQSFSSAQFAGGDRSGDHLARVLPPWAQRLFATSVAGQLAAPAAAGLEHLFTMTGWKTPSGAGGLRAQMEVGGASVGLGWFGMAASSAVTPAGIALPASLFALVLGRGQGGSLGFGFGGAGAGNPGQGSALPGRSTGPLAAGFSGLFRFLRNPGSDPQNRVLVTMRSGNPAVSGSTSAAAIAGRGGIQSQRSGFLASTLNSPLFRRFQPTTGRNETPTPISLDQLVGRTDAATGGGDIRILLHENDGKRSWSVIVPGTSSFGMGGADPRDMLTNVEEVGGQHSAQSTAVRAAMELAGVREGDAVELVGYSQGGIVVENLLATPEFTDKYQVAAATTVGSPVAARSAPSLASGAKVLNIENTSDLVPGLDGKSNPIQPGRMTVYFNHRGVGADGSPHAARNYAVAAAQLEAGASPAVQPWLDHRRARLGLGERTVTSEFEFQTTRLEPQGPPAGLLRRMISPFL